MADEKNFDDGFAFDDVNFDNFEDMFNDDDVFSDINSDTSDSSNSSDKPDDSGAPEPAAEDTAPISEETAEAPEPTEEPEVKTEPESEPEPEPEKVEVEKAENKVDDKVDDKAEVEPEPVVGEDVKESEDTEKAEVVEETPEPVLEKPKKRHRRSKKAAAKADDEKSAAIIEKPAERAPIDPDVLSLLNISIGDSFEEQKKKAVEMMNDIVVMKGMDNDNIQVMMVKKVELSKYVMAMTDKYENIKATLDESLIPRVRAEAELAHNGTASDKKNAAIIALTKYVDPKTKKTHDLLELQAALHSACRFCSDMKNFCDTTGMTLASMLKLN